MAYSDINELYQYYEENPDPLRADIHKKIKSFVYKGNNSIFKNMTWKDEQERLLIAEFDDGVSKIVVRLYDTGEGINPTLTTNKVYFKNQLLFSQAFNYAGDITMSGYLQVTETIRDCSLRCDVVRIENGVETELSTGTSTFLGSTEPWLFFSVGGNLTTLMGHEVADNTLTITACIPFLDNKFAEYKLQEVGWSGSYPQSLSNFNYLEQARTRFNGVIDYAINDYLLDLVQYDMSPLFVDGFVEPITDSDETGKTYFYDCYTYKTDFAESEKELVYHKWGNIKVPSGCRVWGVINNNVPYNVKLYVTSGYEFLGAIQNDGIYTTMTSIDVDITSRKTISDSNGNYYFGALSTNIPIFGSVADGERYAETGDDSNAVYDDVWNGSTTHRFGDIIVKTQPSTYTLTSIGRPYYKINTCKDLLVAWLGAERTQELFSSVVLWGNNPIEMVSDYYWTPLDIDSFGYADSGLRDIRFGFIYAEDLTSSVVEPYEHLQADKSYHSIVGTEYVLYNGIIDGVYNDWRDYELFKFKLYLPFYGTIDLEPHLIINKPLKITCTYFIATQNLHYYIYVNNVIAFEYDIQVGCALPLTGSDAVGKAKDNLNASANIASGVINTGLAAATGNVGGIIDSGIGILSNYIQKNQATSLSTWGATSITGNICDYTTCIMIIEEQQHYAPNNLHSIYNYPSFYIGTISSCDGYCEINDVRLNGFGTFSDSEKDEIKNILKGGIIL